MRTASILAALLLLAPLAEAYPESDAARVRFIESGKDDVLRVWHEPEVVEPGTQWNGFIQFKPGHAIEGVQYQICDVGRVCFAPPHDATRLNDTTWTFDTNDYRQQGRPIRYEAGWRLGVAYILEERLANGTLTYSTLPEGLENPNDLEYHYLAFDMPPPRRDTPAPGLLAVLGVLSVAVAWRRP